MKSYDKQRSKPFKSEVSLLVRVSVGVKRHHDHGNSYKGKHLIGTGLQFQSFSHYHHGKTWQQAGRHRAGEGDESFTS